ncbi:MAG: tRNA uridine-5-carboxymethylaminomethyl(34) synthesis GTPase MnmE [Hydrotalea sp.]|nr:tRNA uridine-5-carboxymethylaminomethyl(34) synthesis GTPase MnmE [Hydrotalea sp.]
MHTSVSWKDTIVALATPQGVGAIGVIRISGPESIHYINQLFSSKNLLEQKSHTLHVGILKDEFDQPLDEVVISLFRGPRSYTGEDVVEISCHGSSFILQKVMQAITHLGARMARPGEFTQRAFLHGKMDLTQAEAVADLIASSNAASARQALHHIKGGFSKVLLQLREELIRFSALIELELDFSQEDVEFADRKELVALISHIKKHVHELLQSFQWGNVIKQGVNVAIVGKPNAGKSTLLNALLNENRAIVSDIAGTTRDTIEEVLQIDGILFRLIDTAGIREHTSDMIEQIGVEKSLQKIKEADLILYVYDVASETEADIQEMSTRLVESGAPVIYIGNKADQNHTINFSVDNNIFISAKQGAGLDELRYKMVASVQEGKVDGDTTLVTNARHVEVLQKLYAALVDVEQAAHDRVPGDLMAIDIRQCLQYLGEITGQISHEDQLDYIFSKFCIGK